MLLADVKLALKNCGYVCFYWGHNGVKVYSENGRTLGAMDGRSYQGFLRTVAPTLRRTETGSTEDQDLIICWRS
jgi:hypothetical protein